jgi:hypothetical protein
VAARRRRDPIFFWTFAFRKEPFEAGHFPSSPLAKARHLEPMPESNQLAKHCGCGCANLEKRYTHRDAVLISFP